MLQKMFFLLTLALGIGGCLANDEVCKYKREEQYLLRYDAWNGADQKTVRFK
jgi:hypothetical protein